MTVNPTKQVVQEALSAFEEQVAENFAQPQTSVVTVNGLDVPVVRLRWKNVNPFFEKLFDLANESFFSRQLPACTLTWNKRFRNVGGRIDCRRRVVELSAAHYESCGCAALGVVLLHEQIHLSLFEEGLAYGHTPEFKRRSYHLGLPKIHHEMPLPDRLKKARPVHLYKCDCGTVVRSRVRFRKPRACAECCNRYASGRYDRRFQLKYAGSEPTNLS